ncbi:GNAT family N-acetyltransferase [Lachnospiraceae bacterium 62-35]
MVFELKETEKAAELFGEWQETLIWSCLQGVMGEIHVDSLEKPLSAKALLGDFCFLAGKPDKELVLYGFKQSRRDFMIMVPQNKDWADLIEECYGKNANKVVRYGIKKEPGIFNQEALQAVVDGLPEGYTLTMIDETLFWHCRKIEWCKDWVFQYEDYDIYQKYGLGAVILKEGEPVSGASSYSGYIGGIEVEIITREDYRRKGLAYICGAKLILECLKRGWYPSWDAQNKWSAALAEKLGYHFDHEYPAYEVTNLISYK